MKGLLSNPVLMKELKLRFRAFKSFSGLMFYLAVLIIFVSGFLLIFTQFSTSGFFVPSNSFTMFSVLSVLQMALVMFITPGLTAGAISTEREKQTLNILLTTTQSSSQIIIGKLLSSVAFLILMLIAGLPLYSIVFLFGGVSPGQFFTMFFFYLVTLIAIGSIGIMFSTITKRTIISMIATYGAMIFLGGITAFFFFVGFSLEQMMMSQQQNTQGLTTFLPISYFWASINPGVLILTLLIPDTKTALIDTVGISFPNWIVYLIFYVFITIVCLTIAIRKLRANMKTNR
ncbi:MULTISPECIES: ABC transporter permease [Ureibacillus]|jgi:ABC-2 type transport system permease protein|uniref:ABC-type transport system involved in multi-copper enzyme maturation permease subunit n=1 Tax=Ureibacillus thermosphaericus TaxID=51173 RepID=A0A840Q5R0_URETH|nr:ABC transporter permease [Ureibacillus thermosphaericus]MBB5150296.1 ABC-type transport system involved in multi-copper enzyme maturation permease subunit [Ureibacillus thermosphaericus]NKZ32902.1 ABC transporter permease subunit [Ureibacillus thermosphaericus]